MLPIFIIITRASTRVNVAPIDLDPICQRAHCRMRPAATTILRDVLIAHPSEVRVPIDILPCERLRQFIFSNVVVWYGMDDVGRWRRVGDGEVLCVKEERNGGGDQNVDDDSLFR